MTQAPAWLGPLLHQFVANAPGRALLLMAESHPLATALIERLPQCDFTFALDARSVTDAYPLAVVAGLVETLERSGAQQLLATLRDRAAMHTVLWLDLARSPLTENDLRALAFRVHARDGTQLLCSFDLQDYKDRPDWLNARHWAHPELWGKFRW